MDELHDRVAVVTGAASGIGLGIAEACCSEGMRVVLSDWDGERLGRETDRLRRSGSTVEAVQTDVGDPEAVDALADAAYAAFGSVHIICNNAGIIRPGRTWELTLDDWEQVLQVNLMGVIHGIRSFVPRMLASGEPGHVVNVGSMASVVPVPGIGAYNVAKHGVLALSEVLQAELAADGEPVGVTIVMPGRVPSRLGRPIDAPDDPPAPLEPGAIDRDDVGAQVVAAVRTNQLHLFTHPERVEDARRRFARITDG